MGLLSHLFGNRTSIAKELAMDADARIKAWDRLIRDINELEEIGRNLNFKNRERYLADPQALEGLLERAHHLLTEGLIEIEAEEKADEEIVHDLQAEEQTEEDDLDLLELVEQIISRSASEERRFNGVLAMLRNTHDILGSTASSVKELQSHARARTLQAKDAKKCLDTIFQNLFYHLPRIAQAFNGEYAKPFIHKNIQKIARDILVNEDLKRREVKAEEKFMLTVFKGMTDTITLKPKYRVIAKKIFKEVEKTAGPLRRSDGEAALELVDKIERLIQDEPTISAIVARICKDMTPDQQRQIVVAFKRSFDLGAFEDWMQTTAT